MTSQKSPQFEDIHDELIGNYLEKYPSASYEEARDSTSDAAYSAWVDECAVQADLLSDAEKDRAIEAGFKD